jgi:NAD(P)-dependent dehydrogenase (short-subunit alcohol dehydrogenase family)
VPLDLGSQASIQSWSDGVEKHLSDDSGLDALVHHAGVMGLGHYTETVDGEEMQWAINYSGPFRLTQRLWEPLLKRNAR